MQKYISAMLSLSVLFALQACSNDDASSTASSARTQAGEATSADSQTAPAGDSAPAPLQAAVATLPPSAPLPPETPKSELCSLDALNGTGSINQAFNAIVGQGLTFEGWVANAEGSDPGNIVIILDGDIDFQISGKTGTPRADVAASYGAGLANAGFKIELPELNVPAGQYELLVTGAGSNVFVCNTKARLIVG